MASRTLEATMVESEARKRYRKVYRTATSSYSTATLVAEVSHFSNTPGNGNPYTKSSRSPKRRKMVPNRADEASSNSHKSPTRNTVSESNHLRRKNSVMSISSKKSNVSSGRAVVSTASIGKTSYREHSLVASNGESPPTDHTGARSR